MIWLKDFRMAGFLVSRGYTILGMRLDARGDVEISFDNGEGKVDSVLHEYPSSVEFRYDTSTRLQTQLLLNLLRCSGNGLHTRPPVGPKL